MWVLLGIIGIVIILFVILLVVVIIGPSSLYKKYGIWKDLFSARMYIKGFKKPYFYDGWGTRAEWENFRDYMENRIPLYPSDVEVEWVKESEFGDSITRVGKFLSPMSEVLHGGFEYAHFAFTQHKDEAKRNDKLLVIHIAGGQKGYGWRLRNHGNYFVKKGYSVLCPIPPTGIFRARETFLQSMESASPRKKVFENVPYTAVSALPILHACSQEARFQINYLIRNFGFRNVVITGQSWGGTLSVITANYPCVAKDLEDQVDIAIVPVSANNFLFGRSFTKMMKISEKLDFETCPEKELAMTMKSEGKSPLDVWYKMAEMTLYAEFTKQTKNSLTAVTIVQYEYDVVIVPDWEKKDLEEFCKGILKRNGVQGNENFRTVLLPGGHFTAFVNPKKNAAVRKIVEDQFNRMEKVK